MRDSITPVHLVCHCGDDRASHYWSSDSVHSGDCLVARCVCKYFIDRRSPDDKLLREVGSRMCGFIG